MLVLSLDLDHLDAGLHRIADFREMFDILEVRLQDAALDLAHQRALASCGFPILLKFKNDMALVGAWELRPFMVDVPWQVGCSAIEQARRLFPDALLQGSSHDQGDPEALYRMMKKRGFDAIKIAQLAPTTRDVIDLLAFLKAYAPGEKLTCVPIGDGAQFGRLLAPSLGSYLSYCCLPDFPTAAGQIDVATLHAYYSACQITPATKRFGIIGNPVTHSPSHRTHTKLLRSFGIDGIYVKIPVVQEEIEEVLPKLFDLGFSGLSVTTPLKGVLGGKIVNTIKWQCHTQEALNTDGLALLDALEEHVDVAKSSILLLGAGDVGMACCEMLTAAGAVVWVWNRTHEKTSRMASMHGVHIVDDFSACSYDVVVNATSALCVPPVCLDGVSVVAEFLHSQSTNLIDDAKAKLIPVIDGKELWARQAAKQFAWWCAIKEEAAFSFLKKELSCRQQL